MAIWIARKVNRKCKFKRRAKAITIVTEEIYLRDDIRCGSPLCRSCAPHLPCLPADASHYLVPNVDAICQFWEILEIPQVGAVVFLASVLKQVQERLSQRSWRRLRSIVTDQRRSNVYFDDEHCIYTWLTRNQGGVFSYLEQVADWFFNHLEGIVPVVLLTGLDTSKSTLEICGKQKLPNKIMVLDPDTYFKTFWSHDSTVTDLFSSLALTMSETKDGANKEVSKPSGFGGGKATYKEHLSAGLLEAGISTGSLKVGTFFVSKHATSEALVLPSNKGEASRLEISVPGRALQNRALHGDIVAVRFITKEQQVEQKSNSFEEEEFPRLSTEEASLTGEVAGIIQRYQRDYVACLTEDDEAVLVTGARQERVLCIPMDRRIPLVELKTRQAQRLVNQRFIIRIDKWDRQSKFPSGHSVRSLGAIGDLSAEVNAILIENGISAAPFSSLSLQELPEDTWRIPEEEYRLRRDIRFSHRSCSIDPPGSKDVDDVLSVSHLENELLEVGVHIADVSYFVKERSLLDLEARSRGTTVYMVGKSWHMLPALLSENLCSLVGGRDRLAVSVIWTLDPSKNFEIVETWFGRTVIRSRHQLFYAQAETIMEGKHLPRGWEIQGDDYEVAQLRRDLMVLAAFAQNRRALRRFNGALELASTELRFEVNERREPVQVETKAELPMNWIVAEMMILANSFVGEKIYGAFPTCALLRKHAAPKIDNFTMLLQCAEAQGFALDASSNKQLAASLDRMRDSGNPVLERAFRALVTRAMSEAEYFSTGEDLESSHFYHYGLALRFYTHFTSPIRRYADILVHRMLIAACELSSISEMSLVTSNELQEVAEHLNEKHRASKRAQKECNELYLLMYLQKQAKAECAVVIGVTSRGILAFVPKYDLRGLVLLEDKNGQAMPPESDYEESRQYGLVKERTSMKIMDLGVGKIIREYKLMDTIWVRLRADGSRAHGPTLRMDLLSDDHPAVVAAQTEGISYSLSQLALFKLEDKTERTKASTGAGSERMKAIQAMADMLAADSIPENLPHRAQKRLEMADVLQNILQARASSLFVGNETADFAAALTTSNVLDVVVSSSSDCNAAALLVDDEEQSQLSLRRRWQQNLAKAGLLRAKLTTSTSSNESERQQQRAKKELEARANADSIQMQFS